MSKSRISNLHIIMKRGVFINLNIFYTEYCNFIFLHNITSYTIITISLQSFAISQIIAKRSKPYTDGDYVKECLLAAVNIVCPETNSLFSNICLSAPTVTCRIEDLSADVRISLVKLAEKFDFYSLAIDEITDVRDTAQLAVFIRGIDCDFRVTEEFVKLSPLNDTTTGADILKATHAIINDFGLKLEKLVGVTTDGAPAMIGKEKGFISLLEKDAMKAGGRGKTPNSVEIYLSEAL